MIFVFLFLTYFTLYNRFQVHQICVFSWLIFHCIYVPQFLYPFICQWASKFLSCPGDCKQCCGEHWGTCIILNYGLLRIYAQQWKCWVIWQFYSQFSFFFFEGISNAVLQNVCINLRSHQQCRRFPISQHPPQQLQFVGFFDDDHSDQFLNLF